MQAVFVELPAFERHRAEYLDDPALHALQQALLRHPELGPVVPQTGGLRKLRFALAGSHKGKRAGLRIIYYWWKAGNQFWLFTLYGKREMSDLSEQHKAILRQVLRAELNQRRAK